MAEVETDFGNPGVFSFFRGLPQLTGSGVTQALERTPLEGAFFTFSLTLLYQFTPRLKHLLSCMFSPLSPPFDFLSS